LFYVENLNISSSFYIVVSNVIYWNLATPQGGGYTFAGYTFMYLLSKVVQGCPTWKSDILNIQ